MLSKDDVQAKADQIGAILTVVQAGLVVELHFDPVAGKGHVVRMPVEVWLEFLRRQAVSIEQALKPKPEPGEASP